MVPLDNWLKLMTHLVLPKYIHLKTGDRYIELLVTKEANIKSILDYFMKENSCDNIYHWNRHGEQNT